MKVSVLQFAPKLLDKSHNLSRINDLLKDLDTDLLVLPELATCGYVFADQDELVTIAEEVVIGESFQFFAKWAAKGNFTIVYGFPEYSSGKLFNSSVLINPDGSYYVYRKMHLFSREKLLFRQGDTGFFVCEAKGGVKIGMMICYDWQFPEAMRTLALRGAQLICHPANLVLPWCQQAMRYRCLENRVFAITANRTGTETNGTLSEHFTGGSQIVDTTGNILAKMKEDNEGITTVEIDPARALDKKVTELNDAFGDRRPEYYEL